MTNSKFPSWNKPVVSIRVPQEISNQLKNISEHTGENLNALIRPKLRELINSFPEHVRNGASRKSD